MALEVTFDVGGSVASITGVERLEVEDGTVMCVDRAGWDNVVSTIPLESLRSVTYRAPEDAGEGVATITADPSRPGAHATHTVALQVGADIDDFSYFRVDYPDDVAETTVTNVDESDIVRFGVDTDDDGEIEQSLMTGDWSLSHGGSGYTLRIRNQEWSGTVSPGDDIILEYTGIQNPEEPGTYEVSVILNGHQRESATYTIGAGDIHSPDIADNSDAA